MEIGEILSDALRYPLQNVKALLVYLILGIILGIALASTVAGISVGSLAENPLAAVGMGTIGLIITLLIGFLINGYQLDIIRYGIERSSGAPDIEFVGQFINGVKVFVVDIVYFIIPIFIGAILAVIFQHWLSSIITAILFIIFALAAFMGHCRLAKTQDLGYALAVGDAIGDISRIGILKVLTFIIIVFAISFVLSFIGQGLSSWNATVGGIISGILGIYTVFFSARAMGLLYSEV